MGERKKSLGFRTGGGGGGETASKIVVASADPKTFAKQLREARKTCGSGSERRELDADMIDQLTTKADQVSSLVDTIGEISELLGVRKPAKGETKTLGFSGKKDNL